MSGMSGMSRVSGRSGRTPRSKWSQKTRTLECSGSLGGPNGLRVLDSLVSLEVP